MRIREAKSSDARAIAHIGVTSRQAAWRGMIDDDYLDALDQDQEQRDVSAYLSDAQEGWSTVVGVGRGVVGFMTTWPEEDEPHSLHIGALFVEPRLFGKGIGTKLLEHAEKRCRDEGFIDAFLWALSEDARVVSFYAKRGFLPDSGLKTIELDRTREVIRLRKTFSPPIA